MQMLVAGFYSGQYLRRTLVFVVPSFAHDSNEMRKANNNMRGCKRGSLKRSIYYLKST